MEDIKVGEYIRTSTGKIEKITGIYKNDGFVDTDKEVCVDFVEIAKHSKNIIDLIKIGDYINGHSVVDITENIYNQKIVITEVDGKDGAIRHNFLEKSIKEILTKEQVKANCYKVGGK
jgi:hypothetical protein